MTETLERAVGSALAMAVGEAEYATFHSGPGHALTRIAAAAAQASAADSAHDELAVLGWLRGVALSAAGDFGEALAELTVLLSQPTESPRARLVVAWAASAGANIQRQLGRAADADALDSHGLAAAEPLGPPGVEGVLDCAIGLASDAVASGDLGLARERLRLADSRIEAAGDAARWRPRCRLEWSRAEVAMLAGDPQAADRAAASALAIAEKNEAPRHMAKSLLYTGIAALSAGDQARSRETLRSSAEAAVRLGCHPLVWRPAGLLAALTAGSDPAAAAGWLETARASAAYLAAAIPPGLRAGWRARPDVAALLPAESADASA